MERAGDIRICLYHHKMHLAPLLSSPYQSRYFFPLSLVQKLESGNCIQKERRSQFDSVMSIAKPLHSPLQLGYERTMAQLLYKLYRVNSKTCCTSSICLWQVSIRTIKERAYRMQCCQVVSGRRLGYVVRIVYWLPIIIAYPLEALK